MKLSFCIALILLTLSTNAQDSVGRVRKPVLQFLIGEHYRAEKNMQDIKVLHSQKAELKLQIENYQKTIASYKLDSAACDSLARLENGIGITWKNSYEAEKKAHGKTKKKLGVTLVVVGVYIVVRLFTGGG